MTPIPRLATNRLHGPIPRVFGQLPGLRAIDLYDNQLVGPIPAPLLALPRRRFSRNRGLTLPSEGLAAALGQLAALDLSDQDICGRIPLAWTTALPRLQSLYLSGNRLEGPVPLRILMLGKKALGGGGNQLRLPASVAEGMVLSSSSTAAAEGLVIDLRDQGLVGPLPAAFLQLPGLKCLDLSGDNALEGALPLAALQLGAAGSTDGDGGGGAEAALELRLGGGKGNRNAFRLPSGGEELLQLPPSTIAALTRIALRESCLVGAIPRELGRLTALTRVELAGNALEGELPDGLAALVSLETLDLGANHLRGGMPGWLGGLTRLRVLDLAGNDLQGPIRRRSSRAAPPSRCCAWARTA